MPAAQLSAAGPADAYHRRRTRSVYCPERKHCGRTRDFRSSDARKLRYTVLQRELEIRTRHERNLYVTRVLSIEPLKAIHRSLLERLGLRADCAKKSKTPLLERLQSGPRTQVWRGSYRLEKRKCREIRSMRRQGIQPPIKRRFLVEQGVALCPIGGVAVSIQVFRIYQAFRTVRENFSPGVG